MRIDVMIPVHVILLKYKKKMKWNEMWVSIVIVIVNNVRYVT